MLLHRSNNVQIFGYTPRGHRAGRKQSVGLTLKVRTGGTYGGWRYASLQTYWPRRDLRVGRGVATLEACTWRVNHRGERCTIKVFARLKVGLGGKKRAK